MKITVFKNIFDKYSPIYVDTLEILKRIKDGNSKELIDKIRTEKDSDVRDNLKKRLPSICFSGRFGQRGDKFLLEHSGLICLDIDQINPEDLEKIKADLVKDEHVFSCFVSPSGNGLKLLVKITPGPANHKGQFLALEDYFNSKVENYLSTKKNQKKLKGGFKKIDEKQGEFLRVHVDKSGKDVSRVCYESYDSEIYWNDESEIWYEVKSEEVSQKTVEDQDIIISLLRKWIDGQESYYKGNRNNYLSKFLYALCRYGVDELRAKDYISTNYSDYPKNELDAVARSCYEHEKFDVETFTEKQIKTGFVNVKLEDKKPVTAFWSVNDTGKIKIDSKQFLRFIETNGFGIYRSSNDSKKWEFVKVSNMIVDVVTVLDIKSCVLNFVEKNATDAVFDHLQMKNRYFESTFLNALPIIDVRQISDKQNSSYIFFENFYYEVKADNLEKRSYIDLEGLHIWRNQISKKNITRLCSKDEFLKHDYAVFLKNAIGGTNQSFLSACSAIGYGIHTYKKSRSTKLIYACDRGLGELDGMDCGGSGKQLFSECIRFVRSIADIDGKDFDKRDKFKFQSVNEDTQLVVIDDYEGDVTELFTKVTGHFPVEKKSKDKINLEFSQSPKLFVSSNRAPKGIGDSHKRRLHLVEFSNHYNAEHTPSDEFGDRDFFSDDWNQEDYNKLYSFLFWCVQLYLKEGLIEDENGESQAVYKKLVKATSREFADYFSVNGVPDWTEGHKVMAGFCNNTGENVESRKFFTWMNIMCKVKNWKYETKGVGQKKVVKITK